MHTKHRGRIGFALLVAAMAVSLISGCGPKGNTAEQVLNPLGGVLSGLRDTVNGIIDTAGAQGQALTVTAAGQVLLAVSNAESAFATDLNISLDKADDAVRRNVEQLRAMVTQLQSGTAALLETATNDAQQLINTLPFTNKNPQVRAFSPRFMTAAANQPVAVSVRGNFVWAAEKKMDVTLVVGETTYKAAENTTSSLQFLVPASAFASLPDRAQRVSMELHAPYESGVVFKSRPVGVFRLLATVLPNAPVRKVTVTNDAPVQSTEFRTTTVPTDGRGLDLRSWDGCTDKSNTVTRSADVGWTIDVSSIKIQYGMQTPNALAAYAEVRTASPTGFVVTGHTVAHCVLGISNGSGSLNYSVTYTQWRPVHSTQTTVRTLDPIGWGGEQVVPVTRGKWRVRAELWDGTVVESAGASRSNPYLSIDDQGDYARITMISPSQIVSFDQ